MPQNLPRAKVQPVYLYVRCSTLEQKDSGLGIDAQKRTLAAFCTAKGWLPDMLLEDLGESGADELGDRPAGGDLLRAVEQGPAVIVVSKLDRIFRNASDACRCIADWHARGVCLVSVSEGIDVTTPFGRFVAKLFALIAELDRETIVYRTKGAMEVKRSRGERVTRDPPYGWRFVAGDRRHADGRPVEVLAPNAEERKHIALMKQLRRRGRSLQQIADVLEQRGIMPRRGGKWWPSTVRQIINGMYRRGTGGEKATAIDGSRADDGAGQAADSAMGDGGGAGGDPGRGPGG